MKRDRPLHQSDESYRRTLGLLRERVQKGVTLRYKDSTTTGDKYTICTLGLCDNEIKQSQDGLYRENRHACPHDRRFFDQAGNALPPPDDKGCFNGCFYTCRVFDPRQPGDRRTVGERILAVAAARVTDA